MIHFIRVTAHGLASADAVDRPSGSSRCVSFGLACNDAWRDLSGAWRSEVTFIEIECYGRVAEYAIREVRSGTPVMVVGRVRLKQWRDKEGRERRLHYVIASEVTVEPPLPPAPKPKAPENLIDVLGSGDDPL